MQGHARRTHVEDRGDEVDRAQDGRRTSQVERQNGKIHGRSR